MCEGVSYNNVSLWTVAANHGLFYSEFAYIVLKSVLLFAAEKTAEGGDLEWESMLWRACEKLEKIREDLGND